MKVVSEVNDFLEQMMSGWMKDEGKWNDIVLSTRIRLARNLQDYRFPTMYTKEEAIHLRNEVAAIAPQLQEPLNVHLIHSMEPLDRQIFIEKHLMSIDLAKSEEGALLLSNDEKTSIMVNEEDHLRIQRIDAGFQLQAAYDAASAIDDEIEAVFPYAFSKRFGYLTSCPSNTGTGLRASVMMHLPALSMTGHMKELIPAISRLGIVFRGVYGEGSEPAGNIYQISNQTTLGKSENETIRELENIAQRLVAHERDMRESMKKHSEVALSDRIGRAYGILRYSQLLPSEEAANLLSDVRLGIELGYVEKIDRRILNELLIFMQPGILQRYAQKELTPHQRDYLRAQLFRERLSRHE